MIISREIPVTESIIENVKSLTSGFHSIIDIRPTDKIDLYNIDYVAITVWFLLRYKFGRHHPSGDVV